MRQIFLILFISILLIGTVAISGCTIAEETDQGLITTEKTTTTIGPTGIQKTSKTCPFWNPDC